jgi:hypothetical protein
MALSAFVRGLEARQGEARAAWDPARLLSPWQLKLFQDRSELRIADAGRRAGKTTEFGVELLDLCLRKRNARCAFFAKTETDARELIWSDLWMLIDEYLLGGVSRGPTIHFPNGSTIRITGAKDPQEAQRRFRGRGYDLVVGDECQLMPWLRDMIQQAIAPALIRGGRNGRLLLGGTPSEVPFVGYWEEICAGQHGQWSVHTATVHDNPSVVDVADFLARRAAELGGEHAPVYRREYLRERVMPDASSGLVYRYNKTVNNFAKLPEGGRWHLVVSIDLGHTRDTNGIVTLGVTDASPGRAWELDRWKAPRRLSLPDLAREILLRQAGRDHEGARFVDEDAFVLVDTVIDEGGLGTAIADELRRPVPNGDDARPSIACTAADKTDPLVSSDVLNAALLGGQLMIPAGSPTAHDLTILRWDPIELAKGKRKMAKFPHSDLEPCLRYAWPMVSALLDSVKAPTRTKTAEEIEADELKRLRTPKRERRADFWRR